MSKESNKVDVSKDGLRIIETGGELDTEFGGLKRPIRRARRSFDIYNEMYEMVSVMKGGLEEAGKGIVGSPGLSDRIRGVPHEYDFDLYEALYKTEALVFRGINVTAHHVMQPGFTIEGGDEKHRGLLRDWSDFIDLEGLLHETVKSVLIWGNSYFEIVKDDNQFGSIELKPIPPSTMYVYRTETGEVIGYIQVPKTRRFLRGRGAFLRIRQMLRLPVVKDLADLQTEKKRGWKGQVKATYPGAVPFDADEIIHIKDNEVPGAEYGLSVIEPMLASLTIYQGMRLDIGVMSRRYAAPKILWLIGDDQTPASDEMMDKFFVYLASSNIGDDIVMPSWISFNVLGAGEVAMKMESYLQMMRDDVFAGLNVPEFLMGGSSSKSTLASATIQLESFSRRIIVLQKMLSYVVKKRIFPLVIGMDGDISRSKWNEIPTVVFRPMETEEKIVLRAMNLYTNNIASREEVRRLLRLPDEPVGHMWIEDQKEIAAAKPAAFGGGSTGARGPKQSTGGGGDDKKKAQKTAGVRPKDQGGSVGT